MVKLRLTKIVCTIGPSSNSENVLKNMIDSGMDLARLNFSHGDHQSHEQTFNNLRNLCDELAIGIDISGPKIRLGKLEEKITLQRDETVILTTRDVVGKGNLLPINYANLPKELKPNMSIYINDGLVKLNTESIVDDEITCKVLDGGEISSRKGVNIPKADLSIRVPTKKDIIDIEKACDLETDFLFISFVRSIADLRKVKEIVASKTKKDIHLIAKIEHKDSLNSIKEITSFCDGLMVARGDLAIEVGSAKVPVLQKQLIQLGMSMAKPVIVATQMLESMTKETLPTRAEASDVAHAVFDGADALMLSAETATGKHPLQVLKVMNEIILEAEKNLALDRPLVADSEASIGKEIGIAAVKLAQRMSVKAIIALTQTGYSASMVSRNRENFPIYAVTHNHDTKRTARLYWGVKPIIHEFEEDYDKLVFNVIKKLHKDKYLDMRDNVVLVAGSMVGISGKTHTIQLLNVDETLSNEN